MSDELRRYVITQIKEMMGDSNDFPYDTGKDNELMIGRKRKAGKPHMLQVALKQNNYVLLDPSTEYFEIGNEDAERTAPQYHILEDAKVIRMPYRGTKKSKGSQRLVKDLGKRDYGQVVMKLGTQASTKGTYTPQYEYREVQTRNFFGTTTAKTQPREYKKRELVSNKNKRNYRENKHYRYIERILGNILPQIRDGLSSITGSKVKLSAFSEGLTAEMAEGFLSDDKEFTLIPMPKIVM